MLKLKDALRVLNIQEIPSVTCEVKKGDYSKGKENPTTTIVY